MKYQLVKYRTLDYRYNRYAVIPVAYISDLLHWLKFSESAEIVSVTDNPNGISDFLAPEAWPSYRTCMDCIRTVSLLRGR
jgi:hypothetical protein